MRRNHIGDWGTPFGMLIEHLLDLGEGTACDELSQGDLDGFYRAARLKFDSSETFQERARSRVVALQSGDAETRRLWTMLIEQSQRYFVGVYERMDVRLDGSEFVGESAYNDRLEPTLQELADLGLIRDSDGAACLYPPGFVNRDGDPLPLIVRKRDGGYGYAATDLAALRERTRTLGADRVLYVVGAPQSQHLEMIYATARLAGWLQAPTTAEHVAFGSVLGTDGKMFRSRAGDTVRLADLIADAIARAETTVAAGIVIGTEAERALGLQLSCFPDVVEEVGDPLLFHRLAGCLFETATAFSGFYAKCPVLDAPDRDARLARLALCILTARVLATGLGLLGIRAPQRM